MLARARALVLACSVVSACTWQNRPPPSSVAVEVGQVGDAAVHAARRLRVVTFNVAMQSVAAIHRAVQSSPRLRAADVLFLQEIEHPAEEARSRAAQLARLLGMEHAYAPAFGRDDGGSHGIAILSRHRLSDVRAMELPRREVHYNTRRRVALAATVHAGARPVRLYCVHLDLRIRSRDRLSQLAPVLEAARRDDLPVVIAGDFNTTPFTWLWRVVPVPGGRHGAKLEAFARSRGFDTPLADSGPTSPWLSMRLDGMLTSRVRVARHGVERGVRISDHLPVWADITWDVH
jgi:endonuclease/exonuclease/phosphatase family metal-dependent hydrolase